MLNSFLHPFTYERLKRILTREFVEQELKGEEEEFQHLGTTIREIDGKPSLLLVGDQTALLYVTPCYKGLGDYRLFVRINEVPFDVASVVNLELNLGTDLGFVTTMPRSMGEIDSQSVFLALPVKRRNLTSLRRFKRNVIAPVKQEESKLNQKTRALFSTLENQQAIEDEWMKEEE